MSKRSKLIIDRLILAVKAILAVAFMAGLIWGTHQGLPVALRAIVTAVNPHNPDDTWHGKIRITEDGWEQRYLSNLGRWITFPRYNPRTKEYCLPSERDDGQN